MTIKRTPEDFCVEEILTGAARGRISDSPPGPSDRAGLLAVYRLVKMRLTTPEAASAVAKALGVPTRGVGYLGLKDKYAHTLQYITVAWPGPPEQAPPAVERPNWQIQRLGWVSEPLTSQAILANRFAITVRGLSRRESDLMDESAGRLSPGAGIVRIVNYFGDQRFGSARHGRGFVARRLIAGEFEEALKLAIATPARKDHRRQKQFKRKLADGWGKWRQLLHRLPGCPERAPVEVLAAGGDFRSGFAALPYPSQWLFVEAYQSWLWNRIARTLIGQRFPPDGVITAPDPFGTMVFPAAAAIGEELAALDLPLLGRDSPLLPPWQHAAETVLREEGITTVDLRVPGLRRPYFGQAARRLFVDAAGFSLSQPEAEEPGNKPLRLRRLLTFDLPRGAYAVVLLRALGQ
jgi:tRNA pseudouridine13 synthase